MQAPKKNVPEIRETKGCPTGSAPGADKPHPGAASVPDANVAGDAEHCIVPAHAESTRLATGEPCEDGRNAK